MTSDLYTKNVFLSSNRFSVIKKFWEDKLTEDITMGGFMPELNIYNKKGYIRGNLRKDLPLNLVSNIFKITSKTYSGTYLLLLSGVIYIINRYIGFQPIILGVPVEQDKLKGGEIYFDTILPLQISITGDETYKEFLISLKNNFSKVKKYGNIPPEFILDKLRKSSNEDINNIYKTVAFMENIHDKSMIQNIESDVVFNFSMDEKNISMNIFYNKNMYSNNFIERLLIYLVNFFDAVISNPDIKLKDVDILSREEKRNLLSMVNKNVIDFENKTINKLFTDQVKYMPKNVAVSFKDKSLTYEELDRYSDNLANVLIQKGVKVESIVGVIMDKSLEMFTSIMAILKAGAAYLPIDPAYPTNRIKYMLNECNVKLIISQNNVFEDLPFTLLSNIERSKENIVKTPLREFIKDFNNLPVPDRGLINLANYNDKIGMACVKNVISLQTTRGCPYSCVFCHKVWSKNYVCRDADNIYEEILFYYEKGIVNFEILDDCFNLNIENGKRLFNKIIDNKIKINIFFPNGLRGDILTTEYVDLMVKAGVVNINLSLESASPRMQKIIKKNLDIDKFKHIINYIATKYPNVILELATMHGFPFETEEDALMTMDFIKSIKWIHFPYIHILKIYPNTEMEELALSSGVSKEEIMENVDLAYHEIPSTIPFSRSFTEKYKSMFLNDYFLSKERLKYVLPIQLKVLSEDALVEKYNTYLPTKVESISDILELAGISSDFLNELHIGDKKSNNEFIKLNNELKHDNNKNGRRIIFIDLSQYFNSVSMQYKVVEQPLGHLYLGTYIKKVFGDKVEVKIYKSGVDFDSFDELKTILDEYQPEMINIRSLSFYKDFFHQTVSLIREWGYKCPLIAGGPYATSEYEYILQDRNIDIAILGEGEYTMEEFIREMFNEGFNLPKKEVLNKIKGIAYFDGINETQREIFMIDKLEYISSAVKEDINLPEVKPNNLAYVMYTSGSTGIPKGVMIEHSNVVNCLEWLQKEFTLKESDIVAQRTNLTFDPSVWEMFWPICYGAQVMLFTNEEGRNAEYILDLLSNNEKITALYCPASLISAMTYLLSLKPRFIKMPYLFIGAEQVSIDTINNIYPYLKGTIINTYGPTECTINNIFYPISRNANLSYVPLGKAVDNNYIYILNKEMQILPYGVSGEIYIGGNSIGRGYINNDIKTKENFVQNPFGNDLLYKTGDIGKFDEDGNVVFLGRIDTQVKIRGYRIELQEIKSAILKTGEVRDCIVVTEEGKSYTEKIEVCKRCGITSKYPNVTIKNGVCNICKNADEVIDVAKKYFKTPADLCDLIKNENKDKKGKYDCLLVYSCERVATYALYRLVEMGFNVLTATYDSGHISQKTMENIKRITEEVGVDHIVLRSKSSIEILRGSLKTAHTMCKGCIQVSTALAGEYAYRNNINIVICETLSRGQIIENKLQGFVRQGITNIDEIEKGLLEIQKNSLEINKDIFGPLNKELVNQEKLYAKVKFVDFYRYYNSDDESLNSYLNNKNTYWKQVKDKGLYSTDCFICNVGDYNFYKEKGYHYNGASMSWETRLGHISIEQLHKNLKLKITEDEYRDFLQKIDYKIPKKIERLDEKSLIAYIIYKDNSKKDEKYLRKKIKQVLPNYMIPDHIIEIKSIALNSNGKIDYAQLPKLQKGEEYKNKFSIDNLNKDERKILKVWREVLNNDEIAFDDNFFDIGGDSIKGIQLALELSKNFVVTINDIFKYQSPKQLSKNIKAKDNNFLGQIDLMKKRIEKERREAISNNKALIKYKEKYELDNKKYNNININNRRNYKNILITGATGFLGVNLINEILEDTESNVYLLIRSNSTEEATIRIKNKMESYFGKDVFIAHKNRINVLKGDITQDKLGVSEDIYNFILKNIDCVIHAAANVKFYCKYDDIYNTNVNGTKRVVDFCLFKVKKDLYYISTVSIANGTIADKKEVLFTEYNCDLGQESSNNYIKTKLEAECIVLESKKKGLNANILRLGNLMFNSTSGRFQENIEENAFYALIQGFLKFKMIPDLNLEVKAFDISFIDYACKAIVRILEVGDLKNEVYHILNPNKISYYHIGKMLKNIGCNIEIVSIDKFCDFLYKNYESTEYKVFIEKIIIYSNLLDETEATKYTLLSDKTNSILGQVDFKWPEVSEYHIRKMIEYCKSIKFI